jgi:hypothetical protein
MLQVLVNRPFFQVVLSNFRERFEGLRRLLKMKNAELRHMRTLAATILGQRTDTEQFFLEALQEVCRYSTG